MFQTMVIEIFLSIIRTKAQWITPNSTLPRRTSVQVTAAWNDQIFLFSGSNTTNVHQLVTFSTTKGNFTDYGTSALNISNTRWEGEVHGQIQNLMYLPNYQTPTSINIYVFDLSSNQVNTIVSSISGPSIYAQIYACFAAINHNNANYLYMVGGADESSALSIVLRYRIPNAHWDTISSMNTGRYLHSCIIDQDKYLWAVGGILKDGTRLASIERVLITSNGATWQYNHQSLVQGTTSHRSVLYEDNIYVIGGNDVYRSLDYVTIINTKTGNVSILSDKLNYNVSYVGAAIAYGSAFLY